MQFASASGLFIFLVFAFRIDSGSSDPCANHNCGHGTCHPLAMKTPTGVEYECLCSFFYKGDYCDSLRGFIIAGLVIFLIIITVILYVSYYFWRKRMKKENLEKLDIRLSVQDSIVPPKEQRNSTTNKEQHGVNPGPHPADYDYPSSSHGAQYPYPTDRGMIPPVHHPAGPPPMHIQEPYGQHRAVISTGIEPPPVLSTVISQPKYYTKWRTAATVHLAMRPQRQAVILNQPVAHVPVVTPHVVHRAQPGYIQQPWYLN